MNGFEEVLARMKVLHEAKNHDYGDSFSRSFKEFGLVAPVVRMSDKWSV